MTYPRCWLGSIIKNWGKKEGKKKVASGYDWLPQQIRYPILRPHSIDLLFLRSLLDHFRGLRRSDKNKMKKQAKSCMKRKKNRLFNTKLFSVSKSFPDLFNDQCTGEQSEV